MAADDNDLLGRGELPADPAAGGTRVHAPDALGGWGPPIPLETPVTLPAFPVDVLPPYAAAFVRAVAAETQSPVDLAGMFTLSALSTVLARSAQVAGVGTHTEPLVLWTCACLASGERKSAVFQHITRPLFEWERGQLEKIKADLPRREAERRVLREMIRKREEQCVAIKDGDREAALQGIAELAEQEARLDVKPPRLLGNDVTPEALVALMQANGGRIALLSAEGGLFDVMKGQYSRSPNLGVFLAGHAGDDIAVDRIGREALTVPQCALTVGISPQPFVLRWATNFEPFAGTGILGRFLYALPRSMAGRRSVRGVVPIPPHVRDAYEGAVRALLDARRPNDRPVRIRLIAAAIDRLLDFSEMAEARLGATEDESPMRSWLSKLPGAVLRAAGVVHVAAEPGRPLADLGPITEATMRSAVAFGNYLIPHAEAVFGLAGPEMRNAVVILKWLTKESVREFQARKALAARQSVLKNMTAVTAGLRVLVDHEFIRPKTTGERHGAGRPSSPWYEVNPAAAKCAPR